MSKPYSRRNFLTSAGLTTLGLACSTPPAVIEEVVPPITQPARRNRIGHGDFTYAVDKRWGVQNLAQYPVMHCQEMVMDDEGRLILLTTDRRNNILVYNKDGKVTNSWTHDLTQAHGLTIAGEGSDQNLWITDSKAGRVLNVSLDGRLIRELVLPAGIIPANNKYQPTETAIAPNGDVYVADGDGSNLILHYDNLGRLKHFFGGPEYFDCAHGITLDTRTAKPSLLITSQRANNFQRWSLDGNHLKTYEMPGLWLCRPVISGDETYFAVISTNDQRSYDGMLAILNKDMNVISLPGGSVPPLSQNFQNVIYDDTFLNPHDVCVDEDGNLYVPQWNSGRTYPVRLKRS